MENQKKSTMVLQIVGFSLFYTLFVIAGISLSLTLFQSTNVLLKLSGLSLFALSVVVLLLLISELYEICRKYARWRKLKKQLSQELSKIIQEYIDSDVDSETEQC